MLQSAVEPNAIFVYLAVRASCLCILHCGLQGLERFSCKLIFLRVYAGEKNDMTVKMIMGCALAIGGFCIYSHAKMYAKPQAPPASAADLEAAQQKVLAHTASFEALLAVAPYIRMTAGRSHAPASPGSGKIEIKAQQLIQMAAAREAGP